MRYLKTEEVEQVKKLHENGWLMKNIAREFGVCAATVSNIVRGDHHLRKPRKSSERPRDPYAPLEFKEEVFKDLPDTVLFEHVRIWDFIG